MSQIQNTENEHNNGISSDDIALQKLLEAKNLNKPRVTPDHVLSRIKTVEFLHPETAPTLTLCVITLVNGFVVTGESACAHPENFNAEIGRDLAKKQAVNKIWLLEGYLLRQHLFHEEQTAE